MPTHFQVLMILSITLHSTEFSVPLIYAVHTTKLKINDSDKPYMAFQAGYAPYQFTRVPFGVTNWSGLFSKGHGQHYNWRPVTGHISYLDNVTICGKDQREHNVNPKLFLEAGSWWHIKYSKCVFSTLKLAILGCIIEEGDIRPDPECQRPLQVLPVPEDRKTLGRTLEFYFYHFQWIHCYSEKIRPLATVSSFPTSMEAKTAFETLKKRHWAVGYVRHR